MEYFKIVFKDSNIRFIKLVSIKDIYFNNEKNKIHLSFEGIADSLEEIILDQNYVLNYEEIYNILFTYMEKNSFRSNIIKSKNKQEVLND